MQTDWVYALAIGAVSVVATGVVVSVSMLLWHWIRLKRNRTGQILQLGWGHNVVKGSTVVVDGHRYLVADASTTFIKLGEKVRP